MTASIQLSGVSKRYRKYDDHARVGGVLGQLFTRTERSWFTALSDVDLDVQPGESLGVIGRNGAGKSTLLQMLCGVTAPTSGRVTVRGRVAPLISVGVGFHPEMTGRENVYVNGTILGLTRPEIDRRFDAIVEFSELSSFIDTPVKFYSSGMFVRLGFAVAVEARPDVLLVDEVLAVGDFAFQVRCFERMNEIRSTGTTIVVVSHNMNSIRGFCDRGVVLDRGRVAHDGTTFDAIACYYDLAGKELVAGEDGSGGGHVELVSYALQDDEGRGVTHQESGRTTTCSLTVRADMPVASPFLWVGIENAQGQAVYSEARMNHPMPGIAAGEVVSYDVQFPADLPSGNYTIGVTLRALTGAGESALLVTAPRQSFYVTGRPHVHGTADLRATFTRRSS
ncbi:MAG: transporter ATP-binding protein [Frankiales bacterium]|nr:transporter ATP-binding protein [Frankiales bacterium]